MRGECDSAGRSRWNGDKREGRRKMRARGAQHPNGFLAD